MSDELANNQMKPVQQQSQSIQLVPIRDIQILDNLKTIIGGQLVSVPIRAIPISNAGTPSSGTMTTPSSASASSSAASSMNGNNNIVLTIQQPASQPQPSLPPPPPPPPADQPTVKSENDQILNLEEMSVNKLREKCVECGLPKTGVKQKLIERLKNWNNQQQQQIQRQQSAASTVKSPDSGVNLDVSPSFQSCKSMARETVRIQIVGFWWVFKVSQVRAEV